MSTAGDDNDAESPSSDAGPRPPAAPDLDFDIDDLASALQLDAPRKRPKVDETSGDAGIEELDDILEVAEDPTHPRKLYVVVEGRVYAVTSERFVIGRVSSQCDLAIIDANVSRQHCAIERRDGLYFVTDLGSTNGIEIDGERVDNHPIEDGDVFVISGHRIECSFDAPVLDAAISVVEPVGSVAPLPSPAGVTGRLAAVPRAPLRVREPEPEPEPELVPEPDLQLEPEPEPIGDRGESSAFETRVELRLAAMCEDIAALRTATQKLVEHVEALKGVDALAQLIQRRLSQAKR